MIGKRFASVSTVFSNEYLDQEVFTRQTIYRREEKQRENSGFQDFRKTPKDLIRLATT